jgi:hypothetical protein
MSKNHLEDRLAQLEAEVVRLRAEVAHLAQPRDWRSVVGMFAGDEFMKQVDEAGRKIREKDRQRFKKAKVMKKPRLTRS